MPRPSTPTILAELRSPSSAASHLAALRALKNEVIGHEQKKSSWVRLGIIAPLSRLLQTAASNSRRSRRDVDLFYGHGESHGPDEEALLQVVIILGSLAHGGPAYLAPLQAGAMYPALLSLMDTERSSPSLVLAILRSLNSVADALCLQQLSPEASTDDFTRLLYSDLHLRSLAAILDQRSTSLMAQQQINLVASLLTKTCRRETQQKQLALSGILNALARRLASFIAATSQTAGVQSDAEDAVCTMKPATSRSRLGPILQAIGSIILDSKLRTKQFVWAIHCTGVFSQGQGDAAEAATLSMRGSTLRRADQMATENTTNRLKGRSRSSKHHPSSHIESDDRAYATGNGCHSALRVTPIHTAKDVDLKSSPLIPWLVTVVRAEVGATRLMASWMLTLLYRTGLGPERKEMAFAPFLVPLLVRMLDDDHTFAREPQWSYDSSILQAPNKLIMEYAPQTLAMLIVEDQELQQVAYSAGVILKLSDLLKYSYSLRSPHPNSQWSPEPVAAEEAAQHATAATARLGPRGISFITYYALRIRESALTALAAMAAFKDEYRSIIIGAGAVPLTIKSLKPLEALNADPIDDETDAPEISGNPVPVLLAACGTARALSRSVKMLRTSLTDADLATPLYALLQYDNLEVQVAATSVICNLLLEFSPMRESMIEAGIAEILCKRAHSTHAKLRLNSIWSLKHLVHSAPNAVKMKCLEDLGPGWLKQIVSHEPHEYIESASYQSQRSIYGAAGTPIRMGTPNAIGEQVDLLNAIEPDSLHSSPTNDDGDDDNDDEDDEVKMIDDLTALCDQDAASAQVRSDLYITTNANQQRLDFLHDEEIEGLEQATRDMNLTQEQGMDLIRNLVCGPGSAEMIDYLFRELGQDTIFDIFAARLRPRAVAQHATSPDGDGSGAKPDQQSHLPSTPIITSILYIIVNIAAGLPRHRQLLISQAELLRLIVPFFAHESYDVRTACIFLVINLTWIDDQADRQHCRARAHELRRLGVYELLVELEHIQDKDFHERATLAMNQMTDLLK